MEGQKDLIVNYLPQTLSDDEFKSMFMSIGPIKSCKIIRDHATNYSFGFGFVEYDEALHAVKAIETLNGLQLQNKRIKVAYSRKGEDVKGTNLYIRGLPPEYKQDDLRKLFSPHGEIVNCRVLIDQSSGQGRGVGFVLYSNKSQAKKAIQELNGKTPVGSSRSISVQFAEEYTLKARPGGHYLPFGPPPSGLPFQSGSVVGRGNAPRNDFNSGVYNGYGQRPHNNFHNYGHQRQNFQEMGHQRQTFQEMGNPRYGQTYNSNSNQHSSTSYNGGRTRKYDNFNPSIAAKQEFVLFVYNIGPHSDEVSVLQIFSPFGYIAKVAVVKDPATGQSKGYGFVTMTNYQEAQNAVTSLNGYRYMGRPLQVSFKQ